MAKGHDYGHASKKGRALKAFVDAADAHRSDPLSAGKKNAYINAMSKASLAGVGDSDMKAARKGTHPMSKAERSAAAEKGAKAKGQTVGGGSKPKDWTPPPTTQKLTPDQAKAAKAATQGGGVTPTHDPEAKLKAKGQKVGAAAEKPRAGKGGDPALAKKIADAHKEATKGGATISPAASAAMTKALVEQHNAQKPGGKDDFAKSSEGKKLAGERDKLNKERAPIAKEHAAAKAKTAASGRDMHESQKKLDKAYDAQEKSTHVSVEGGRPIRSPPSAQSKQAVDKAETEVDKKSDAHEKNRQAQSKVRRKLDSVDRKMEGVDSRERHAKEQHAIKTGAKPEPKRGKSTGEAAHPKTREAMAKDAPKGGKMKSAMAEHHKEAKASTKKAPAAVTKQFADREAVKKADAKLEKMRGSHRPHPLDMRDAERGAASARKNRDASAKAARAAGAKAAGVKPEDVTAVRTGKRGGKYIVTKGGKKHYIGKG